MELLQTGQDMIIAQSFIRQYLWRKTLHLVTLLTVELKSYPQTFAGFYTRGV